MRSQKSSRYQRSWRFEIQRSWRSWISQCLQYLVTCQDCEAFNFFFFRFVRLSTGFTHWWQIGVAQCRSIFTLSGIVWHGLAVGPLYTWGVNQVTFYTLTLCTQCWRFWRFCHFHIGYLGYFEQVWTKTTFTSHLWFEIIMEGQREGERDRQTDMLLTRPSYWTPCGGNKKLDDLTSFVAAQFDSFYHGKAEGQHTACLLLLLLLLGLMSNRAKMTYAVGLYFVSSTCFIESWQLRQ